MERIAKKEKEKVEKPGQKTKNKFFSLFSAPAEFALQSGNIGSLGILSHPEKDISKQ